MLKKLIAIMLISTSSLVIVSQSSFAETRQEKLNKIQKNIENASNKEEKMEKAVKQKAHNIKAYPSKKIAQLRNNLKLKKERLTRRERLLEKKILTSAKNHHDKVMNTK